MCFDKCSSVNITGQEKDDQYSNTIPSIKFHINHLIALCSTHGRLPLTDNNIVASVNNIIFKKNPQKYALEKS